MENNSRTRLLDAALEILGRSGAANLTVRATEDGAGLPHGSVRHHFGHRPAMVAALFDHLAERESAPVEGGAADALEHWLGPGRTLTLARYELFLMAARDARLRAPLVRARNRFIASAAERVDDAAAPTIVAALDGLVLDALVRGSHDPDQLRRAVTQITGTARTAARARQEARQGDARSDAMTGERELQRLLAGIQPARSADIYVFARTSGMNAPAGLHPFATVQEEEGLTLVLRQNEADRAGLAYDYVAARITLLIHSDLATVGLTAAVTTRLAAADISCNVIAGYEHDHLFVPHHRAADTLQILERLATDGPP